ncbi:MAG: membrane protein insertase YidC, partial [Sphaerochaetaceae bacterium]|nr:membrane protein insertase YidC [Sphaerochaetaceae bacterium]
MEKNTILAVVLSVIVITVGMTVQATLFPSQPNTTQTTTEEASPKEYAAVAPSTVVSSSLAYNSGAAGSFKPVDDSSASKEKFTYSTNVFTVTFDPVGASVSSIKLNKHLDNGQPAELLFNEGDRNAFLMYAGRDTSTPIDATFQAKVDGNKVVFSQHFISEGSSDPFTITKTYTFGPDEYLFSINVDIQNSINAVLPLSFENEAYTLAFEPQIGPAFTEMKQDQYSYRRFYTKADGSKKKKQVNMRGNVWESDSTYSWVALVGKYFSAIVIPDIHTNHIQLTQYADENAAVPYKDKMYFSRSATRGASIN